MLERRAGTMPVMHGVLALSIHFSTVICLVSRVAAGALVEHRLDLLWEPLGTIIEAAEGCVAQVLEQPLEHYVQCLRRSQVVILLDSLPLLVTCSQVTPQNP